MTRKDYILIAHAILDSRPINAADTEYLQGRNYQADTIAETLADALAEDNPNFNRARFLDACGLQS